MGVFQYQQMRVSRIRLGSLGFEGSEETLKV